MFSRGGGIGGGSVSAGARSVCGVWVGACACGVAGEAVMEDTGEAGVEWLVVEASVVRPAGRLRRELACGRRGF